MKPIRNENYTCSICNKNKTDTESRQSFDKDHNPICWECQLVISLEHDMKKIRIEINRLEHQYEKLNVEKLKYIK